MYMYSTSTVTKACMLKQTAIFAHYEREQNNTAFQPDTSLTLAAHSHIGVVSPWRTDLHFTASAHHENLACCGPHAVCPPHTPRYRVGKASHVTFFDGFTTTVVS